MSNPQINSGDIWERRTTNAHEYWTVQQAGCTNNDLKFVVSGKVHVPSNLSEIDPMTNLFSGSRHSTCRNYILWRLIHWGPGCDAVSTQSSQTHETCETANLCVQTLLVLTNIQKLHLEQTGIVSDIHRADTKSRQKVDSYSLDVCHLRGSGKKTKIHWNQG